MYADLTLPLPGSTTTRQVLGRALRGTLSALSQLPMGRFHARQFDEYAMLRAEVTRLARAGRQGALFAAARRHGIATLVHCLHAELRGAGDPLALDAWLAELDARLALELARSGELSPEGIELATSPRALAFPEHGIALRLAPELRVGFLPGRVVLGGERGRHELAFDEPEGWALPPGCEVERCFDVVDGELRLATFDENPLWDREAHPEKFGNAIDLGGRTRSEWITALRDALALVDATLPELAAELRLVMQRIVPVGYDAERHLSASYGEAVGLMYLTLHPDPMTMAEALIHEFSHNKLNALLQSEGLLENAFSPLYASPVRPDPRPLHGVLLAVHAFVPVARLYERLTELGHPLADRPGFASRLRDVVRGNHEGTETLLQHARPLPAGRPLLEELGHWDTHFARFRA